MKLLFCLDPLRASITGIGRYTYELAKGLQACTQLEDLKFQYLFGWVDDPQILIDRHHSSEQVRQRGGHPNWVKQNLYPLVRSAYQKMAPLGKGIITLPYKNYIYHSPNYEIPNFVGKTVSTVHDLSILRLPQYHPPARVKHQENIFPRLIKKGSLFITDSEFSKGELLDFFPSARGRVVSVPLGADPMFRARDYTLIEPTLQGYGLSAGRYALSVGTIEPRKNIERLIQAYALLPMDLRMQYPLVLIGGAGWNSEHIHQLIAKYTQQGWLKYLAFVPDQDMAMIYSGARVFACVSHYEGFGLPVLEAMASGIPVISSDAASLPEVGGDAVLYVNPNQTEQITDALQLLLNDDARCQALAQSSLARSQLFSWDRTVQETLSAYQQIA